MLDDASHTQSLLIAFLLEPVPQRVDMSQDRTDGSAHLMRQHRRHLLLHELLSALEFVLELIAPVTEEDNVAWIVVVDDVDDI